MNKTSLLRGLRGLEERVCRVATPDQAIEEEEEEEDFVCLVFF